MATTILHVNHAQCKDTASIAKLIYATLGITEYYKHTSDNYPPEGIYYKAESEGKSIIICHPDDYAFDDCIACIVIYTKKDDDMIAHKQSIIKSLLHSAFLVFEEDYKNPSNDEAHVARKQHVLHGNAE